MSFNCMCGCRAQFINFAPDLFLQIFSRKTLRNFLEMKNKNSLMLKKIRWENRENDPSAIKNEIYLNDENHGHG